MGFFNKLFGKQDEEPAGRIYSYRDFKTRSWNRYIVVSGPHLHSVEQKLQEYAELPAKGNTHTYTFQKAKAGNLTILRLPDDFNNHYEFHNLTYWFLGFPPEDENYADRVTGLAIGEGVSYAIYHDDILKNELNLEDDLPGTFSNNEQFILAIPFDEFKPVRNSRIKSFDQLLRDTGISVEALQSGRVEFSPVDVLFNEKVG